MLTFTCQKAFALNFFQGFLPALRPHHDVNVRDTEIHKLFARVTQVLVSLFIRIKEFACCRINYLNCVSGLVNERAEQGQCLLGALTGYEMPQRGGKQPQHFKLALRNRLLR